MAATIARSVPAGSPAGGSTTRPQPASVSGVRRSAPPAGGFSTESGTTATRRERRSPRTGVLHGRRQLGQLRRLVVVEQVLSDPDHPRSSRVVCQQTQQRLREQPRSWRDRVVLVARLVRPATPVTGACR